jgi:hypothetical protein
MDPKFVVAALRLLQSITYPPLYVLLALKVRHSPMCRRNALILAALMASTTTLMPKNACVPKPSHTKMLMQNAFHAYFQTSSIMLPEDANLAQTLLSIISSWASASHAHQKNPSQLVWNVSPAQQDLFLILLRNNANAQIPNHTQMAFHVSHVRYPISGTLKH